MITKVRKGPDDAPLDQGPGRWFGREDLNPQWLDQNQLCCELHHARSVGRTTLTHGSER